MRFVCGFLTVFLLSACSDPVYIIPGGKLSGDVSAVPEVWGEVPEVVQLEMRSGDPYSVNIWAVADGAALYVATQDSNWVPYIAADNQVRVRVAGIVYELRAALVDDDSELQKVMQLYIKKYDIDSDEGGLSDFQLYRLTSRS